MRKQHGILIGTLISSDKRRQGFLRGPNAYRTAGLADALRTLGHRVTNLGNITAATLHPEYLNHSAYRLEKTIDWAQILVAAAQTSMADGIPVFLGVDHALSLGSVAKVGRHATEQGRPQFVLWLDAHSDFNIAQSSHSGNLHGTPLAYLTGGNKFPMLDNLTIQLRKTYVIALNQSPHTFDLIRNYDVSDPPHQFATYANRAGQHDRGGLQTQTHF